LISKAPRPVCGESRNARNRTMNGLATQSLKGEGSKVVYEEGLTYGKFDSEDTRISHL
jgi:hypothetical protein